VVPPELLDERTLDWLSHNHIIDQGGYSRSAITCCKPPFAGPAQVLAYLARYTHRVAIANERLVALEDGRVRFRWRDYADGDRVKVMELDANEFIRRFLLHIVPTRFMRIRYFGLLANRGRAAKLARCRALLAHPAPPSPTSAESVRAVMLRVTGIDIELCPVCHHGRLRRVESLPPTREGRTPVPVWDTS